MIDNRQKVRRLFKERYGHRPAEIVHSPGRINIIGEHTDYSLLPVLPVAMNRGNRIAIASTDDGRIVAQSANFASEDADLQRDHLPKQPERPWHRYLLGVVEQLAKYAPGKGAEIAICGDLPFTGGLSSSSSLVLGLLEAFNLAWDLGLARAALVDIAVAAERLVSVECGQMDQRIIAFGQPERALRIDFSPLNHRPVPLPRDLCFVAAYSGEGALKGGNAKQSYNDRVIGCRLAARLLAQRLNLPPSMVLGSLMGAPGLGAAAATLPDAASAREIAEALGIVVDPLLEMSSGEFPAERIIPIRGPALHVFGEAHRVEDMEIALLEGNLSRIGSLLDQSHTSLATLFGCSTPSLDQLCKDLRRAGALGARLTGAGFGGYAIAAATPETIDDVLDAASARTGGPAFEVVAGPGLGRISRSGTLQAAA